MSNCNIFVIYLSICLIALDLMINYFNNIYRYHRYTIRFLKYFYLLLNRYNIQINLLILAYLRNNKYTTLLLIIIIMLKYPNYKVN